MLQISLCRSLWRGAVCSRTSAGQPSRTSLHIVARWIFLRIAESLKLAGSPLNRMYVPAHTRRRGVVVCHVGASDRCCCARGEGIRAIEPEYDKVGARQRMQHTEETQDRELSRHAALCAQPTLLCLCVEKGWPARDLFSSPPTGLLISSRGETAFKGEGRLWGRRVL